MRFTSFHRTVVLTLTAAALIGSSACFGSFNVTRKVYGANKNVSTNKFVREVVFLAFNIVPVYAVAGFVDAVVVNSVEFWSGKNPVQMASRIRLDGETTLQRVVYDKNGVRFMTIKAFTSGKLVSATTMALVGSEHVKFETVLADGRRVSNVVRMSEDGSAVVTAGKSGY
jgi:Domain of unknown function (DUF3332)